MPSRPSLDEYFVGLLRLVGTRSTCPRRQVGAIITDTKGVMLGMGYNGVPRGIPHCIDTPCAGAGDQSGDSSRCVAVHAEMNAIMQCSELIRARVMYTTTEPCFICAKLISNTQIERVVYLDPYPDMRCEDLFRARGIELIHFA